MSGALLLDTGPLVASLDRGDPHHPWVVQRFASLQGRVLTTGAVITEAAFFLQDVRSGVRNLVALLDALRVEIWDCFNLAQLHSAEKLMADYADTPMDFADASLVLAAEHYGVGDIVTLDERGFRTFRYHRKKQFRLLLQEERPSSRK
jgi:predicted nucleic acid-binding protein